MKLRISLVVAAVLALTACDAPGGNDDASSKPLTYERWRPVYRDVRAATGAEVEELFARVDQRSASDWTAHLDGALIGRAGLADTEDLQVDLENTANHVRFTAPELDMEVHSSFTSAAQVIVLCTARDETCKQVSLTADLDPQAKAMTHLSIAALQQRRPSLKPRGDGPLPAEGIYFAHVESPIGMLDCLFFAASADEAEAVDDQPVEVSSYSSDESFRATTCVDANGLVVLDNFLGVIHYQSFEEGVTDDIHDYPFPVEFASKGPRR